MIGKKKKYKLGDFNYSLPKKFIAQYPETKRDHSKLMVCLLYTSPSPRDMPRSRMPSSA